MTRPALVWLRRDLRITDNPALTAAASLGVPVVPVCLLDEDPPGTAAHWWLNRSLDSLGAGLARLGAPLVLRRGEALDALLELAEETGAGTVLWNRCWAPAAAERDRRIAEALEARGLAVQALEASLLFTPAEVRTKTGGPYQVFGPFWRTCRALPAPAEPLRAPASLTPLPRPLRSDAPEPAERDFSEHWTPGETAARERLADFLDGPVARYAGDRDRPDRDGTSRLSPHLQWGEIGPRQVWHAALHAADAHPERAPGIEAFLRELGWREFCQHQLHHFPTLPTQPLDTRFVHFPWRADPDLLEAWRRGRTGYPIVDAGMRQLLETGWMHNRVRMVVASFLVKDLLLPWQAGEEWFREALLDADPANNPANWQWVAGSGADAAPFFRIFNPITQGEKFDPQGAYVRRWVPELADLPDTRIHKPWPSPPAGYPPPVVDHGLARQRALAAFAAIRGN